MCHCRSGFRLSNQVIRKILQLICRFLTFNQINQTLRWTSNMIEKMFCRGVGVLRVKAASRLHHWSHLLISSRSHSNPATLATDTPCQRLAVWAMIKYPTDVVQHMALVRSHLTWVVLTKDLARLNVTVPRVVLERRASRKWDHKNFPLFRCNYASNSMEWSRRLKQKYQGTGKLESENFVSIDYFIVIVGCRSYVQVFIDIRRAKISKWQSWVDKVWDPMYDPLSQFGRAVEVQGKGAIWSRM